MRVLKNTKEIIKIILQKKLKMKKEKPQQVTRQKQLYQSELTWIRKSPQARATKQQARIDRFEDLKDYYEN